MKRRIGLLTATTGVLTASAAAFPAPAPAHGLVGRADLPIPSWLFGWAAAVVLVVSFVALGSLWPKPKLQQPPERRAFRIPAIVDVVCGAIGVGLFVLVVYAGYAGSPVSTANFAPTFVYVIFWVGVPIASVLFGDIFRAFNPWRAVARATAWVGKQLLKRTRSSREYPGWLGRWPAVAGVVGFAWMELAYQNRADPSVVATAALLYATVQFVGMGVYGIETWSERGDAFGVLFGLYARLSALQRRRGVLYLRLPLGGVPSLQITAGTVALLCAAIGSTTFDGLSAGSLWRDLSPHLSSVFHDLGAGVPTAGQWSATLGLIACIGLVTLVYRAGIAGMHTVGRDHNTNELAAQFAHTLIPIAFAYALAHYFSLLAYQGQAIRYLISNPLGDSSNLFGTANTTIDYGIITTTGIWYVQVASLVTGHLAGLTLAHDRAVAMYQDAQQALRSQAWMLVVMVGFTSLGLWLLSAVVT